eukprot:365973-Chlamydomonas_euryale.AAC.2
MRACGHVRLRPPQRRIWDDNRPLSPPPTHTYTPGCVSVSRARARPATRGRASRRGRHMTASGPDCTKIVPPRAIGGSAATIKP